jgi:hypothetical protein
VSKCKSDLKVGGRGEGEEGMVLPLWKKIK